MTRSESFQVVVHSVAEPGDVFAHLADGAHWSDWAGPFVPRSAWETGPGSEPPPGVGAIRRLGLAPFFSREQIVAFEPGQHLAYTLLSGLPVRRYQADVDLTPDGTGTRIEWSGTFEPTIPGTGRMLRAMLNFIVKGFARRLALRAAGG
jgi:hypothetical protein